MKYCNAQRMMQQWWNVRERCSHSPRRLQYLRNVCALMYVPPYSMKVSTELIELTRSLAPLNRRSDLHHSASCTVGRFTSVFYGDQICQTHWCGGHFFPSTLSICLACECACLCMGQNTLLVYGKTLERSVWTLDVLFFATVRAPRSTISL
jgi:hypothetical protein